MKRSHIAALLSYLIKATEARKKSGSEACTSKKCSWLLPAQDVGYSLFELYFINLFNSFHQLLFLKLSFLVCPVERRESILVWNPQIKLKLQRRKIYHSVGGGSEKEKK